MAETEVVADRQLMEKISKILDVTRTSYATHNRKLKELYAVRLRSASVGEFSVAFVKCLTPIFLAQRRTAAVERVIRFVSAFASTRGPNGGSDWEEFLEGFLKFLLSGAVAANRNARFRACQIISEIILRLPDDAEVSNELWDDVIECMKLRVGDKVPVIRTFAVRSLSRFVNDAENSDILDLLLEVLPLEQNPEVRKTILVSLPPSNATTQAIIDCTLDVSESVRKEAYSVIANKIPLQSLSIKLRTTILQRGLADRSINVSNECLKLMKDEWLSKCCQGDPAELLKYLDVETYESVGESVMEALLSAGLVPLHDGGGIRKYISSTNNESGDETTRSIPSSQLMEAEVALYWRTVCMSLHKNAQAKGSDAAAAMGAEAAVYAAEASDNNDLLESILPASVSDYVDMVKVHIDAGPNHHFASRQLLLLGTMFDFSDATFRKTARSFVQDLLRRSLEHEIDEVGNKIVIGDGVNLGGDVNWADAVSNLAKKVHAASGEFEEVVVGVVDELARPCRERTADFMQWMHMLSVTGLLLENAISLRSLQGKAIEPEEILLALLLPGAKHNHLDVQRVAIKCLGLFGLLENKPSEKLVKQLRLAFTRSPPPISVMACKALVDLAMWHGPHEVDKAMGQDLSSQLDNDNMGFVPIDFSDADEDLNVKILDLLYAGLESDDWRASIESGEIESVKGILGEGLAKFLLLGEKYPSLSASFHLFVLTKLIALYFSEEAKEQLRFKQCLSVFFEHYGSLSGKNKGNLSKAFIPVLRSMWPGINGNPGGSPVVVSNKRKRAVQASKFMLQMMQAPLYTKENRVDDGSRTAELPGTLDESVQPSVECGEDGLAIRIMTEIVSLGEKKNPAEKAYVSALCRILVMLRFTSSEQTAINLIRRLLNRVAVLISSEKDLVGEVKLMAKRLREADLVPDNEFSQDQANSILERLGLEFKLDVNVSAEVPETPIPCSTRPTTRTRRHVRKDNTSSDEEDSPYSVQSHVPTVPGTATARSHRASKAAALIRMTANRAVNFIGDNEDEDEEGSEVTTEESD